MASDSAPSLEPDKAHSQSTQSGEILERTGFVANDGNAAEIKAIDMLDDLKEEVIRHAKDAITRFTMEREIAEYMKKIMEESWGKTWHCIVGSKFGSYVTHESRHFIYFYMGDTAILLFKTQ